MVRASPDVTIKSHHVQYGNTELQYLAGNDIASKLSAQNTLDELFSPFTAMQVPGYPGHGNQIRARSHQAPRYHRPLAQLGLPLRARRAQAMRRHL
ncbi:hypothetical protein BD414DRAFT_265502 [Trametes punicea]|nr:hypothetical protein BD414DRAFT_265502 [Trametes punicea]